MGGNWLGMALGKDKRGLSDKIVASACLQCPTKVKEASTNLGAAWGGFINWGLGKRMLKVLNRNLDYLAPVYKQLYDFDLISFVDNMQGILDIDQINWRICKQKNL